MQQDLEPPVQALPPTDEAERSQKSLPQEGFTAQQISPATDADVIAYLRRSAKLAEIAALAERDALVLAGCEKFGITVSEEEVQAAGDDFRQERKLWGLQETMAWLDQQRIGVEDWSQGIRVALLEKKLKEHLFGAGVDGEYMRNRDRYRRVAVSQILVVDLDTAWKIVQMLREGHASFCALALEYSKGKQSQEKGGFVGIRFLVELTPEIAETINNAKEGEILGPVQSKLGYHVVRVEKWFPTVLNQAVREQIMDSLFQGWLKNFKNSNHHG
ncbi:peptidylprolyl isomerase [Mastigocladopsis repens]|uniref:peptidylprolyl isomerase n=1 Tax=Mastigocladopsis repens TaxID=221287 RepID=UPI0002E35B61|nr:peptidylprolyl isomerase [Mastigocladopsis repens]